jgi:hypothetical protein
MVRVEIQGGQGLSVVDLWQKDEAVDELVTEPETGLLLLG